MRTMSQPSDLVEHCFSFILQHFKDHQNHNGNTDPDSPLFVGLNGVQGACFISTVYLRSGMLNLLYIRMRQDYIGEESRVILTTHI